MWKVCYITDDCDVDEVMDGMKIDRSAKTKTELTMQQIQEAKEYMHRGSQAPRRTEFTSDMDEGDETDSDAED
jgi:hypothetical protein